MRSTAFELEGSGGRPIRGDVRLPEEQSDAPRPVVVLVHGFKGFRRWGFWPAISETLTSAGMAVVGFDMSHNGVGEGGLEFDEQDLFEANTWAREEHDLDTVLGALRAGALPSPDACDPARLGLLGHSRGGGLVVVRAAADDGVRATLALAPTNRLFRFDEETRRRAVENGFVPIVNQRTGQVLRVGAAALAEIDERPDLRDIAAHHASRLERPLLVCHGEADPAVPCKEGRSLAEAAGGRFELFPGADHVLGCRHPWGGSNPDFDRFLGLAADFFGHHV